MSHMIKMSLKALWPILLLILSFTFNIRHFKDDASLGPNQIAITFIIFLMSLYAIIFQKKPVTKIFQEIKKGIILSKDASLILLVVGALISVWMLAGIVPSMVYYGLKLISPSYFLPIVAIISAIVSLATGSSWASVGTVGVAFIGIGDALGIHQGMTAGAIVSGAFLGDKLSPLSDTTNLASAVTGTSLVSHIRHMLYTSLPAFLFALIFFFFLGKSSALHNDNFYKIDLFMKTLKAHFEIGPHLFILPLIMGILVMKKYSPLIILTTGVAGGILISILFQPQFNNTSLLETILYGFKYDTKIENVNLLLNRGGLFSFIPTLSLMVLAMILGPMLDLIGSLNMISAFILKTVKGVTSLILSTLSCGVFINMTTSDVYLSIVLTGKIFEKSFKDFNLHSKNLSRTLEDAGTSTSALIPWNTGGLYVSSVLGVTTFCYLPFAFFNLLGPLFSILLASLDYNIIRYSKSKH